MTITNTSRVDFHHHLFPTVGRAGALLESMMARSAWPAKGPSPFTAWTPQASLDFMDGLDVATAVLSLPNDLEFDLPAADRRSFARDVNELARGIVDAHPSRFGFFAHLPTRLDVDSAMEEVRYACDELGADGVILASVYGRGESAHSLGDPLFEPLWAELDRRKALVFVHGEQTPGSNRVPNSFLPIPVSEVPNETYKAAADLVTSGRKRQFANVRIILSHSGGSTPVLAARVAGLAPYAGCEMTAQEIIDDFRTFYYETALSGFEANLAGLERFVPTTQILFGTDFPAVTPDIAGWYAGNVDSYFAERPDDLGRVMYDNAAALLPRLGDPTPSSPRLG